MRVLFLTENFYPNRGGMAQSCDRITHTLRNMGVFIHIIHFSGKSQKTKSSTIENGIYTPFPIVEDEAHTLNLLWNYLANPSNQSKYTCIIAYGGYLPLIAAPVFSKWLKIPLITLIRGNDFDLSVFSGKKREVLFYALENSAHICTVSSEKKQKIEYLFPDAKISFIPNGIDCDEWKPLKSNLLNAEIWKKKYVVDNKKVIGLFGFLKAKKGIHFFLQAIEKSGEKDKFHLLITGETSEEITSYLQSINFSYTILPFLDRFELLDYYPACDIIAIPSFYDGMPNVLLEALALGIPVIASSIDGMKDVLKAIKPCFLFHPGDLFGCMNAIKLFLSTDTIILNEAGKRNVEFVKQNYSHIIEGKNYIKIIQTIHSRTT